MSAADARPRQPWTRSPAVRFLGWATAVFAAGLALGHGIEHRKLKKRYEPRAPDPPEVFEAHEPGRGRIARNPLAIPHKGWTDISFRVVLAYFGDRIGFIAGGVTYLVLLSLVPALSGFVALYGLFADPATAWDHLTFLASVMPPVVAEFIGAELRRLAVERTGDLGFAFLLSLGLALWSANAAVKALFYGFNVAYHETEKRHIVRYNLLCLAFTVAGLAFLLIATALVVLAPLLIRYTGLPLSLEPLAPLRWPALLLVYFAGLTLAYRYGPCRARARWRWLTIGAVAATLASGVVSLVFSWYLTEIADFRRAYGPLGAVIGFMLWTWLSVQVVLMGAVLNAEIEHQTAVDTTTGKPLPMGQRGALMADTIGPRRGSPRALAYTLKHAEAMAHRAEKRRGRKPPT